MSTKISDNYKDKLAAIQSDPALFAALATQCRGLEKESLRIDTDHLIAQTPHPSTLGSALCNPQITNDFSEAQLELITPVHQHIDACLHDLHKVHQFTYQQLNAANELLWTASMPCVLPPEREIPIANFGSSNVARMKTTYRRGLSYRYQSPMQTISGIHYNFSLNERFFARYQKKLQDSQSYNAFKTAQYFSLIRNFHRNVPLFVYLFGASPAFDQSLLLPDRKTGVNFESLQNTRYLPHATSLRMSDVGYTSKAQESLYICYNHLDDYTRSLRGAIKEPFAQYEAIGLLDSNNNYKQLSTALLQIENEFYGVIRPKRVCASGEAPINALNRAGVEYIEVRCVDIDPFKPMGVDKETLLFLDLLLLFCLLDDSPKFTADIFRKTRHNLNAAIHYGRDPALAIACLETSNTQINFRSWASGILDKLQPLAQLLDELQAAPLYQIVLQQQVEKIHNDSLTPSAKVLEAIKTAGNYDSFIQNQNNHWQSYFLQQPLSSGSQKGFIDAAKNSLVCQSTLEKADTVDFSSYLKHYYQQY